MKIDRIYVGGWFPRTMLQLTEIYDFLRKGTSKLDLDKNKLTKYRKNLGLGKVDYGVSGEEYLIFTTNSNISVKIFEDGLTVLSNSKVSDTTLFADIDILQDYYENKLSPAINYLFSLGAPVPKELANIENVYPYFIVCDKASEESFYDLLNRTEQQKYFEFRNSKYDVIRGDKYYFINNNKASLNDIEKYIEQQIFIREFKGQLHRYLNLHRIIWEKIDKVKENAHVKGKDIIKFTSKLEGYSKTVNLIDGRINQMGTYISTREKIVKNDTELQDFLNISGYRYETLRDTLDYIKYLWSMTKNYVSSAQKLFAGLKNDVSNKSLNSLTLVTSMSAGTSIISLLTHSEPEFTAFGVIYFVLLGTLMLIINKGISYISKNRVYTVQDEEYDRSLGKEAK